MFNVKAILFDVDGVIIDTERLHFIAYRDVLKKYNLNLEEDGYKKHFSGKSIQGGLVEFLNSVNVSFDRSLFIKECMREKIELTKSLFKTNLIFFKDTLDFIDHVKKGGLQLKNIGKVIRDPVMCLVTGLEKVLIDEVLKFHNLSKVFKVIITANDYTLSKPDPQGYQYALKEARVDFKNAIGIEDSPSGIMALRRAEVRSIAITTTHTARELKEADLIVKKLSDLV